MTIDLPSGQRHVDETGYLKDLADADFVTALSATFGRLTSTDGTVLTGLGTLPEPTGVGVELVFTADGLDDIRINGVSA